MFDHSKLTSRIIIKGDLTNTTQFRVGAGEDNSISASDNPVQLVKIYGNGMGSELVPFIPASTLRGTIRHEFLRILNSKEGIDDANKLKEFVYIFGGDLLVTVDNTEQKDQKKPFASLIKIRDAFPKVESVQKFSLTQKALTRINNKRRVAEHGGLFKLDVIDPGMVFNFYLQLNNVDPESEEYRILKFIIKELGSGNISLGGGTSTGLGKFKLENLQESIYTESEQFLKLKPPQIKEISVI